MSKIEMVRYGRINGRTPKNTLYTFKENGTVYFGISRCDIKSDTFSKERGKEIAKQRAELETTAPASLDKKLSLALDAKGKQEYNKRNGIIIHKSGLRGEIPADKIVSLLQYFTEIDNILVRSQQ